MVDDATDELVDASRRLPHRIEQLDLAHRAQLLVGFADCLDDDRIRSPTLDKGDPCFDFRLERGVGLLKRGPRAQHREDKHPMHGLSSWARFKDGHEPQFREYLEVVR